MDQKPKTVATSPPPKRWLNRTKTFFEVPNRRIVRIFLISSFATFALGIALAFEWAFHGKNHTGFEWIIYYALSLIFSPLFIWLGLGIVTVVSFVPRQVASSVVEEEQQQRVDVSAGRGGNEETEDSNCRSLAVAVAVDPANKKCIEKKIFEDITSKLKRTASFPLHSQVRSCRTR